MKRVTLLDTSVCSLNAGDSIIMDAVRKELLDIIPNASYHATFVHDKIGKSSRKLIKNSDFSFVGGTNILSSDMLRQKHWKIGVLEYFYLNDLILLGVGWGKYQQDPTWYTSKYLQKILSGKYLHSVRDSYSEDMLRRAGVTNVINTGCPTMWRLTKTHCKNIPTEKSKDVILTLTDYRKSFDDDRKLIDILARNYEKIYFWPQGVRDYGYANDLSLFSKSNVEIVNPNLQSYDNLLNSGVKYDFVGTRLHGGIRALQKGHRAIIIGVDNRALEKAKDFKLNVINRSELDCLEESINSILITDININENNINKWKEQFI
jgi:polysaccharide pyruvyl transferase WcaK-like protein